MGNGDTLLTTLQKKRSFLHPSVHASDQGVAGSLALLITSKQNTAFVFRLKSSFPGQ